MAKPQAEHLFEGVSKEQLESFKEKYGSKLKHVRLPLDDDRNEFFDVIAIVPDRRIMGEFEKWMDKNPDKAKDILISNCLLSGKERVKADDDLFFTCANAIAELIPIRKAIIKNFLQTGLG